MTWVPIAEVGHIIVTDARRRLDNEEKAKSQQDLEWLTIEEKAIMFGEFKGYAIERGKGPGYATFLYKERFCEWPSDNVRATPTLDCSAETRALAKDIARKYALTQRRKGRK